MSCLIKYLVSRKHLWMLVAPATASAAVALSKPVTKHREWHLGNLQKQGSEAVCLDLILLMPVMG